MTRAALAKSCADLSDLGKGAGAGGKTMMFDYFFPRRPYDVTSLLNLYQTMLWLHGAITPIHTNQQI